MDPLPTPRISLKNPRFVEIVMTVSPWLLIVAGAALLVGTGLCAAERSLEGAGPPIAGSGLMAVIVIGLLIIITAVVNSVLMMGKLQAARALLLDLLASAGGRMTADEVVERTGWSVPELKRVMLRLRRRRLVTVAREEGGGVMIVRRDPP